MGLAAIRRLPPEEGLAGDETLLGEPAAGWHWWVAAAGAPGVVVGLGLHHRLSAVVDLQRCRARGVAVLERRAGGGAVLVDEGMLCGAIVLPTTTLPADVTESYRWLGETLVDGLRRVGVHAQRVEVAEARADLAALRSAPDPALRALLNVCYGGLSPHEVIVDGRKLVGLAQVRRRDAALFQVGVLLRDQSPLADFLVVDDEATRERIRSALEARTLGLASLTGKPRAASAVAAAIEDATPCAPSGG